MACACRGGGRAGARTSTGATVRGYQYTAPDKTETVFLTKIEAVAEQRRNGGGTILQLTNGA
ncbi:DUF7196 family protein [Mycolicibacterium fortuitum]|uniref:DUF7196 family protein n=1 Tax=Mycolicibacterium fortuitum TaxID=1766 RepID=UPI003AF7E8D7